MGRTTKLSSYVIASFAIWTSGLMGCVEEAPSPTLVVPRQLASVELISPQTCMLERGSLSRCASPRFELVDDGEPAGWVRNRDPARQDR